ncbi:YgfZ/GcvT domain-containing protein [Azomonas macrocytogenes]|uniref:Folate-binding protein YgfZ n=1 Tax=Azomonas macrocytogenes TaxID=69962 RepID=A0A839T4P6_AZOMA|nr:folate-binding protein YgfZ [Azomonas macrocytogenes]MBB3104412.1 hypothetical protein [Azomonas macrocytogenes]
MTEKAFFCILSHEGILAVRGLDASNFLQGQLTCNMKYLTSERSSLGARCTPKGRMQSSFRILADGDGYLLAMAGDLLEPQITDLKKYAAFSKSALNDESTHWLRFGLYKGDDAILSLGLTLPNDTDQFVRTDNLIAIRLPGDRAELWVKAEKAEQVESELAGQLDKASLNAWLLAQIRAGVGQVFGTTRELFIPQMLNLQALGGVSFKKGCYTGQEIVARMQYQGKLKRRLYRLNTQELTDNLPAPGVELFSPVHSSSVGEVVLAASTDRNTELLAVVQEDAIADGRLNLTSLDGPALTLLDLPYELDSQRDLQR